MALSARYARCSCPKSLDFIAVSMKRIALILACTLTASPAAAQGGLYAGPVVLWDSYEGIWGGTAGVMFQGLEANRRVDVRIHFCCQVLALQPSVQYAAMFNETVYGTVGPAFIAAFAEGESFLMLGLTGALGAELRRSETLVVALELGMDTILPYYYSSDYGFDHSEFLHSLSMRLVYRRL